MGISVPRGRLVFLSWPKAQRGRRSWLEEDTSGNVTCGEGEGGLAPRPPEPGFPSSSQQESRGSPSDWNHTSESLPLQTHSVTSESFPGLPIKPSWDKSCEQLLFRADKRLLVFFHQYLNTCLHSWAITDAQRLIVITEADLGGDSRDAIRSD